MSKLQQLDRNTHRPKSQFIQHYIVSLDMFIFIECHLSCHIWRKSQRNRMESRRRKYHYTRSRINTWKAKVIIPKLEEIYTRDEIHRKNSDEASYQVRNWFRQEKKRHKEFLDEKEAFREKFQLSKDFVIADLVTPTLADFAKKIKRKRPYK